jgi:hypothetical protein
LKGFEQVKLGTMLSWLCRALAGVGSLFVSAYGVFSFSRADFAWGALEASLFCILPLLSFPAFALSFKWPRLSVAMHWLLAAAYLAVFSTLAWRTCSDAGYCQSVMGTLLKTATARPVEATFAVAVVHLGALVFQGKKG